MDPSIAFKFKPETCLGTYKTLWRGALEAAECHFLALQHPHSAKSIDSYLDKLNVFALLTNGSDMTSSIWKTLHPDAAFRREAQEATRAFLALKSKVHASMDIARNITLLERVAMPKDLDGARLWKLGSET